jgi:DNA-binding transcriptional ArsR family regulator
MTSDVVKGQKYLAIIGDVVRSKELLERGAVQRQLRIGIDKVNELFAPQIDSKFVLTIGDEFQGLLQDAEIVVHLLAILRTSIHPVEQRIGIGIGTLDTPLEGVALGMDGPCFHRARNAIERAKESVTPIEVDTGKRDALFRIYSLLYAGLRRGWTSRQREVLDLTLTGNSGKEIARLLGISPSAVSQHLKAAEADVMLDATQVWLEALKTAYFSVE